MYLIVDNQNEVLAVVEENSYEHAEDMAKNLNGNILSNHDIKSFEEAVRLAAEATEVSEGTYLPCNYGPNRHPRFAVICAPQIGDPVSYAFNGDYYPCGHITKMSDSFYRIQTSTGDVFYRSKDTAGWKMKGGTWWMVAGHHDERNPHF